MTREKSVRKNKETTLTFKKIEMRASQSSSLGLILNYLKESQTDTKILIQEVLFDTYLPFVIDRNSPEYQEKAIRCICRLNASIKAIEEFSGITLTKTSFVTSEEMPEHESEEEFEEEEDEEWEEEESFFDFET